MVYRKQFSWNKKATADMRKYSEAVRGLIKSGNSEVDISGFADHLKNKYPKLDEKDIKEYMRSLEMDMEDSGIYKTPEGRFTRNKPNSTPKSSSTKPSKPKTTSLSPIDDTKTVKLNQIKSDSKSMNKKAAAGIVIGTTAAVVGTGLAIKHHLDKKSRSKVLDKIRDIVKSEPNISKSELMNKLKESLDRKYEKLAKSLVEEKYDYYQEKYGS